MHKTGRAGASTVFKPFIPPEENLPEITVKAVLLGVTLTVILAGANAYLGLFAGMTVSASIPAAVISMGILKL
ncbi:MAG: OPT/YSL family transporter, partial [Elusimicrobia bacterium]|nr:OPT/YSL family transporter [Elusimicrobiota bacterium]